MQQKNIGSVIELQPVFQKKHKACGPWFHLNKKIYGFRIIFKDIKPKNNVSVFELLLFLAVDAMAHDGQRWQFLYLLLGDNEFHNQKAQPQKKIWFLHFLKTSNFPLQIFFTVFELLFFLLVDSTAHDGQRWQFSILSE